MQTKCFDLRDTRGKQQEFESKVEEAAGIIRDGGLLGIPTETVYGLGANGLDEKAVARIFEAKGRPQDNPLILHLAGAQWLPRYCEDVPPLAYMLARKFWPGPLTMILKKKACVPLCTTAGLDTVGVRCPDHPVTLAIIKEAGVPVAAPSANASGRPSCTSAEDVLEDMSGKIEGVVDGGPCSVGVESTILDLTVTPPRLLRPGGLALEVLEAQIGQIEVDKAVLGMLGEGEKPKAPGMKYRHYAPKAPVTVITGAPEKTAGEILRRLRKTSGVICFDEFAELFAGHEVRTLGRIYDQQTQAQRVFEALRSFDNSAVTEIYAQCPDSRGLGLAVSNRLKKAAGFHVIEAEDVRAVIGLTGGTGSGKTSALNAIRALGGKVIDCDALYYKMLAENGELRAAIDAKFPGVVDENGNLDRKRLGEEVFTDKSRAEELNEIVYAFIVPELERRVAGKGIFAIDAINLLESGAGALCDRTVAVTAPMELRVRRIMERDGISEQYARMRASAQKTDDYYRDRCDYELRNICQTPEEFQEEARTFFQRLIENIRGEKRHLAASAAESEEAYDV